MWNATVLINCKCITMPFEIGNKLGEGNGRKGFEIEQAQLEKMRKILDKDLEIIERIQGQDVIDAVDREKLQISQARVSKYLDKLHVSKSATDITTGGESINKVLVEFLNGKDNTNTK